MDGAEHFREAENHLHHAACAAGVEPANEARHLSYAQVHATLAAAGRRSEVRSSSGVDGEGEA